MNDELFVLCSEQMNEQCYAIAYFADGVQIGTGWYFQYVISGTECQENIWYITKLGIIVLAILLYILYINP